MNQRTALLVCALAILSLMPGLNTLRAQDISNQQKEVQQEAAIKTMIDSRKYTFVAQSARPTRGSTKQLTSIYELKVKTDTLQAYLPYFGRSYSPTLGTDGGGIDFTTLDFTYLVSPTKKGGWDITLTPKHVANVSKMTLSLSPSGYGNLVVTSNTRDLISYYGYIQLPK
jgi:Domain of unknown function (DUF4251)